MRLLQVTRRLGLARDGEGDRRLQAGAVHADLLRPATFPDVAREVLRRTLRLRRRDTQEQQEQQDRHDVLDRVLMRGKPRGGGKMPLVRRK